MATIKHIRQQMLLSQEQFALLLQINRTQLSRAECGTEPMPKRAVPLMGLVEACMVRAKQGAWQGEQVNGYTLPLKVLDELEALPPQLLGIKERSCIAIIRLHYQKQLLRNPCHPEVLDPDSYRE